MISRRRLHLWVWIGAVLLLLIVGGLGLRAIGSHPRWADLGPVSALRTDGPTRVLGTRAGAPSAPVWIVTTGGGPLVFDASSRIRPECEIHWVPVEAQFWDLCSAWTLIWSRQGVLLSYPSPEQAEITPYLRDLDRYPARTEGGHLWADLSQRLEGAARTTPPDDAECRGFSDGIIHWMRCTLQPATPAVVTTRMAALLGPATLTLDDGCLRAGDHVLVWPPEFAVTLGGNRVEVSDGYTGETALWHAGDTVWLGGGEIRLASVSAEAGQRWYGTCEGASAYWLVGGINVTVPATATAPPTSSGEEPAGASTASTPSLGSPIASATPDEGNFVTDCLEAADPKLVDDLPASSLDPGRKHFTHPDYGFSVEFPSDWQLGRVDHFLCLKPQADPGVVLVIGFRAPSESAIIYRTGVGAGDLVTRGTVVILGQEVTRDVLVYQGQDKSAIYNTAQEIRAPQLVVTASLDFYDARSYQEPAAGLSQALQATADQIVASLAAGRNLPGASPPVPAMFNLP